MTMNWFDPSLLEETDLGRRSLYQSFIPQQFGRTGQQQDVFAGMFPRVFNNYLGQLGQSVRSGGAPSLSFTDFLNQQDFGRQILRAPVQETGRGIAHLAGPARWLFNR